MAYTPTARLATGPLVSNASTQDSNNIDDGSGGSDVAGSDVAGIYRLPDRIFFSDCRYRVIETSSLVSILFREAFSHPYISFFSFTSKSFLCYINQVPALRIENRN